MPAQAFALTIAGSDCSAGAGLQADLRTFAALGVPALSVATCVVAEHSGRVAAVDSVDPANVAAQLSVLAEAHPVGAMKTGLTWSGAVVEAIVSTLWRIRRDRVWEDTPLVVDPVGAASAGGPLVENEEWAPAVAGLLLPMATLLTPNVAEAMLLLGAEFGPEHLEDAAATLAEAHGCAVLLKGGHLDEKGDLVRDALAPGDGGLVEVFEAPRISGATELHGTGCVLSAAITAALAKGMALADAVAEGRGHLRSCMENAFRWHHLGRDWQMLDPVHGPADSR